MAGPFEQPLEPAPRFDWERVLRRVKVSATVKQVGLTIATYADRDGSNAYPSVAKLARVSGLHERTVRRALDTLRSLGLLERTRRGSMCGRPQLGQHGQSDKHRLTWPADIEVVLKTAGLTMLQPDEEADMWLPASPGTGPGDLPVDNSENAAPVSGSPGPVSGSPGPVSGSPGPVSWITGHTARLPTHDQPIDKPADQPVVPDRCGTGVRASAQVERTAHEHRGRGENAQ